MEGLTRGQLARRTQINLGTVRFYEQEGLLAAPQRTASGYRKFAEATVDRLEFVKRAKAGGISLAFRTPLWLLGRSHNPQ
jgi:DNA-binding transcriptional MerR regulator